MASSAFYTFPKRERFDSLELLHRAMGSNCLFTVEFKKRTNGEIRVMTCRTGVTVGQTGTGMKYDPFSKALMPVWDVFAPPPANKPERAGKPGWYRMVNLNQLRALRFRGKTYVWRKREFVEVATRDFGKAKSQAAQAAKAA